MKDLNDMKTTYSFTQERMHLLMLVASRSFAVRTRIYVLWSLRTFIQVEYCIGKEKK